MVVEFFPLNEKRAIRIRRVDANEINNLGGESNILQTRLRKRVKN